MSRDPYAPPPQVHVPTGTAKAAMVVLWPAFLAATALNALFFSMFDPADLTYDGMPLELDKLAAYGIGFLICFVFCALSSFMTWSLMKPPGSQPIERRSPYSL